MGVKVISVTQPIPLDTSAGGFMQDLLLIISKFDNELRKQKCVAGMKEKLSKGYWITKAPLGYSKDKNNNCYYINDDGRLIKRGFEMFLDGKTIKEIVIEVGKLGLPLRKQRWFDILKNPFYCGMIEHNLLGRERVKGKHPPLVSEEDFERINIIMTQ